MPTLPSWNDTAARKAITDFVARVTTEGSADYVPLNERIAVFDNDGTLWCEMPVPVQAFFADDRLRALAPEHPEWLTTEPFKSKLAGDMKGVMASGMKGIAELMSATHAGMTTVEFAQIVRDWLATARHPKLGRPYTEAVYQPMLSCSTIFVPTRSPPSSSRAAAWSSCACSPRKSTACRRTR